MLALASRCRVCLASGGNRLSYILFTATLTDSTPPRPTHSHGNSSSGSSNINDKSTQLHQLASDLARYTPRSAARSEHIGQSGDNTDEHAAGRRLLRARQRNLTRSATSTAMTDEATRGQKRGGFRALVRWCEAHAGGVVGDGKVLRTADTAATTWVQNMLPYLSCGQSLMLIGTLCDVMSGCMTSTPAAQDTADGDDLCRRLCSLVVALVRRATESSQLESQSLPLLLSALYGLHRVTRQARRIAGNANGSDCVDDDSNRHGLPAAIMTLLRPPAALVFAVLSHFRSEYSLRRLFEMDSVLCVESICTFLLIMDTESRQAYMTVEDFSLMRNVQSLLVRHLRDVMPPLPTPTPHDAGVVGTPQVHERGTRRRAVWTMGECVVLLHNVVKAPMRTRLVLAQYLLCVLNDPARLSCDERALLPDALDQLLSIGRQERLPLTNFIVERAAVPTDSPLRVRLACFTADPQRYLADVRLGPEGVAALTQPALHRDVRKTVAFLPWLTLRSILMHMLMANATATTVAEVDSELCLPPALLPLTGAVVQVLQCLFDRLDAVDDPTGPERTAVRAMIADLVRRIDWVAVDGQEGTTDGGAQCESASVSAAATEHAGPRVSEPGDTGEGQAALQRLRLYIRCHEEQLFTTTQVQPLSDKLLLNHYVLPVMSRVSHSNVNTMLLMRSTLPVLGSEASRRQLMERLLRDKENNTVSSLYHFFEHLGQCAVDLGVSTDDFVAQLLRRESLDPKLLLYRTELYNHDSALYMQTYTHHLNIALACLLCNPTSCVQLMQKSSRTRAVVTSWLNEYYKQFMFCTNGAAVTESDAATRSAPTPAGRDDAAEAETDELVSRPVGASYNHDIPHAGDGGARAAGAGTELVSRASMERLFTLLLRARCTLSPDMCRNLTSSYRAALDLRHPTTASPPSASPELRDCDAVTRRSEEATAVESARLPPPAAHFVLLFAGGEWRGVALSTAYARHLLATCDIHIFHHVVRCLLAHAKSAPPRAEASDRHSIRVVVLEELMRRLDTNAASALGASGHRVGVSVLFRVLRSLTEYDPASHAADEGAASDAVQGASGEAQSTNESPAVVGAVDEDVDDDAGGDKDECVPLEDSEAMGAVHAAVGDGEAAMMDNLIKRALAWLGAEEVARIAVPRLGYCAQLAPRATLDFLTQRVVPLLPVMSYHQLLRLAKAYMPSAEAVAAELKSRPHPGAPVQGEPLCLDEFVDFMSMAKGLPWCVTACITARYLPQLNFAWCTRLLAALLSAPPRTAVPVDLLRLVLDRVEAQIDAATSAERELLLGVLQPHSDPPGAAPTVHDEPVVSATDVDDADTACPVLDTTDVVGSVRTDEMVDEAWLARRALISACCDKLLLLDKIRDVATLRAFFELHTSALHPSGQAAVVVQVNKVLAPLLAESGMDVKAVLALVRLLRSHGLLLESTAEHILRALSAATKTPETASPSVSPQSCLSHEELTEYVELIVTLGRAATLSPSERNSEGCSLGVSAMAVLRQLARRSANPSRRVALLGALVETLASGDDGGGADTEGSPRVFAYELCEGLLSESDALPASEFARLLYYLSQLGRLDLIKDSPAVTTPMTTATTASASAAVTLKDSVRMRRVPFARTFRRIYEAADAHSRCVMLKAFSTDAEAFEPYIDFMMRLTHRDIAVLAPEDLELVLTATLQLRVAAAAEAVLDAVGTRLLGMLDVCRRSTLVRLLQCHAQFGIRDDALLTRVFHVLEEQCSREVRLETAQIVTLLEAAVQLQIRVPDRLLIRCFTKLEQSCVDFSAPRLAQVGQLIVDLEMGYFGSVPRLVRRIFEHREGYRSNKRFRAVIESLCDVFDVELSAQVRALRLRQRRHDRRVAEYWQRRAQLDLSDVAKHTNGVLTAVP